MIPLDPPFSDQATIGGIVAANISGPRRRLYGTARDLVIGMTFATLEGKLIRSGGLVVKNVAGLDMAKLMIGSFGTLAAIAVVNFRVHPMPEGTRTFVRQFDRVDRCMAARNQVLQSRLQPAAIDILKSTAGYQLLIQAAGSRERAGSLFARIRGRASVGGRRRGSLVAKDSRIHAAVFGGARRRSGSACLVHAFGRRPRLGIFASARFGSRGIGRLLRVFCATPARSAYPPVGKQRDRIRPAEFSREPRSMAAAGNRFCDDENDQADVRSSRSAEQRQAIWPYLNSRSWTNRKPPTSTGACIAGLCLNACPTYRELRVEMDSPRGTDLSNGAGIQRRAAISPSYIEHIELCLACRGCETACPSGVKYGRLVEAARAEIETSIRRPWHCSLAAIVILPRAPAVATQPGNRRRRGLFVPGQRAAMAGADAGLLASADARNRESCAGDRNAVLLRILRQGLAAGG